jgi:DNA-binding beta-propeller fold protein YncE
VDVAPAVAELASPLFSSNTTVAGDADLYVANRGNGTVVRLKQNGTVLAVRRVTVPGLSSLGAGQLNGIAVSPDARHIWVTVTGSLPGIPEGAVIELPAFGAPGNLLP